MAMANHTAWRVESEEELRAWQDHLKEHGVQVSEFGPHERIESIYFRDQNFYPIEITRSLRDTCDLDGLDAELTIEAAMQLEDAGGWQSIEQLWRTKGRIVQAHQLRQAEPA
jgi:catechol-2,3-dioxygenase